MNRPSSPREEERTVPFRPGRRAGRTSERRLWLIALALALVLHAGTVAVVLWTRPFTPAAYAKPVEPPPIQLVFAEPETPPEDPNVFTELPPEAADEAPEHPDFLSNVTSRARDLAAAVEDRGAPRLDGRVESPQIALIPGGSAPPSPPPSDAPEGHEPSDPAGKREKTDLPEGADADRTMHRVAEPEPAPSPAVPAAPDLSRLLLMGGGASDIIQDAMRNPDGGTVLSGGISLNTLAWDYAPWLQWFRREFLAGWTAPYAYRMGMIDGWHVLELVILPDGALESLRLLEQDGHDSLVRTSELALRTMAPYRPLPGDFPEDALILRLKLIYPPLERRAARETPAEEPLRRRSGP